MSLPLGRIHAIRITANAAAFERMLTPIAAGAKETELNMRGEVAEWFNAHAWKA